MAEVCSYNIVGGGGGRFIVFSSRRRHTRYWRDWSSDVCSSDLARSWHSWSSRRGERVPEAQRDPGSETTASAQGPPGVQGVRDREERRVGKECRSRWSPYH